MKTTLFAFTLFFFASAHAQVAPIQFNQITSYGTGCPEGTVSTTVSPDGSTLSVLFDEFRVEVPEHTPPQEPQSPGRFPRAPRSRPSMAKRDCQLRFTANLQPGFKVEAVEISLAARGAVILDPGISAVFSSILVGYNGLGMGRGRPVPLISKQWGTNGAEDNFVETPTASVPLNSGCASHQARGITFDLKNHINAEIVTGDLTRHGLVTVDSADMAGMLKFSFRLRRCGGVR